MIPENLASIEAHLQSVVEQLKHTPPDLGMVHQTAETALQLARQSQSPLHIAHSLAMLLDVSRIEGKYAKAISYSQEIVNLYADLQPDKVYTTFWFNLGICYYYLGRYAESLQAHQTQLAYATQIQEHSTMASALRRIGAVHYEMDNYPLALDYYQRTIQIYTETNDIGGIAGVYNNIAHIHRKQSNFPQSIEAGEKAIELFDKANSRVGLARAYSTMCATFIENDQIDLADSYIKKSLALAYQTGRHDLISEASRQQARIYILRKLFDEAHKVLQEGLKRAEASDDKFEISHLYQDLSWLYEQQEDFDQALHYYRLYHEIVEKLREEATRARFESLEIVHRTQQAQIEAEKQRQLREEDHAYFQKLSHMRNEFMSTASHDLKNPLTSINLLIHMLRRIDPQDREKREDLLKRIETTVDRMRELISNLLDLARIETGKSLQMTPTQVHDLLEQVIAKHQNQAENTRIQLIPNLSKVQLLTVSVDEPQIRQVFANLLSNAIKYTPESGTVTISADHDDQEWWVSVTDTGIGIPKEDIPHLFERFYRVSDPEHHAIEGTGLGLAICKSIVEQHNGTISVTSEYHQGSTFTVKLPLK